MLLLVIGGKIGKPCLGPLCHTSQLSPGQLSCLHAVFFFFFFFFNVRPNGPLDESLKPMLDSLHLEELVNAEAGQSASPR